MITNQNKMDSPVRRSSRSRNTKSALELLGSTPRQKKASDLKGDITAQKVQKDKKKDVSFRAKGKGRSEGNEGKEIKQGDEDRVSTRLSRNSSGTPSKPYDKKEENASIVKDTRSTPGKREKHLSEKEKSRKSQRITSKETKGRTDTDLKLAGEKNVKPLKIAESKVPETTKQTGNLLEKSAAILPPSTPNRYRTRSEAGNNSPLRSGKILQQKTVTSQQKGTEVSKSAQLLSEDENATPAVNRNHEISYAVSPRDNPPNKETNKSRENTNKQNDHGPYKEQKTENENHRAEPVSRPSTAETSTDGIGRDGQKKGLDTTDGVEEYIAQPVEVSQVLETDQPKEDLEELDSLESGTKVVSVTHGSDGTGPDGGDFTEIVILKMGSDMPNIEDRGAKEESSMSPTRKSSRTIKPTPKQAELLKAEILPEEVKSFMEALKPKDLMRENIIVIGGPDGKSRMQCLYCPQAIASREHFNEHILTHPDLTLKPWQCPICYYRVKTKEQLEEHLAIHTAVKKFVCDECGKAFGNKTRFNMHMKYHRDERDQDCPLCDKAFHEYKTLQTHLLQVHKTTKVQALNFLSATQEKKQQVPSVTSVIKKELPQQTPQKPKYVVCIEHKENPEQAQSDTEGTTAEIQEVGQEHGTPIVLTVEEVVLPSVGSQDGETALGVTEGPQIEVIASVETTDDNESRHVRDSSRSCLQGTIKTDSNTQLYKMGLSPDVKVVGMHGKRKDPDDGIIRVKPEGGIAISKKGRWINNQRCTNIEDISEDILEFADVFPGDIGVKIIFKCKLCGTPFPSKSQFQSHMEQNHPSEKPWKCDQCDYRTRMRTSLIIHKKIHTGEKKFSCPYCAKTFLFKQKLNNHILHHENKRAYKCPICEKGFNEKSDMAKHVKRVHMNVRPHECSKCGKRYKEPVQLRNHMETHAGSKRNECSVCHKFYLTKKSLLQHMKSHSCMFHCEICDKSFGSYSGFMAHKVMHDESYGGYRCDICMKVLHTKGSLTRHKMVAHSSERPFQCRSCSKAFKTKKDLKNHLVVHTDDKDYECHLCSYKAKRPENLKVHLRRHNDVKPFQCGVCGREYTQRQALERHLHHHAGVAEGAHKAQCSHCNMFFFSSKAYETHLQEAHGEQETQNESGLKVKVRNSWTQQEDVEMEVVTPHEELITEENVQGQVSMTVFLCEECNSVFTTQDSLASHILNEHMTKRADAKSTDTHIPMDNVQKIIVTDEYGITSNPAGTAKQETVGTVVSIPEGNEIVFSKDQLESLISSGSIVSAEAAETAEVNQVLHVGNVEPSQGTVYSEETVVTIAETQGQEPKVEIKQSQINSSVSSMHVESYSNPNLDTLIAVAESMQLTANTNSTEVSIEEVNAVSETSGMVEENQVQDTEAGESTILVIADDNQSGGEQKMIVVDENTGCSQVGEEIRQINNGVLQHEVVEIDTKEEAEDLGVKEEGQTLEGEKEKQIMGEEAERQTVGDAKEKQSMEEEN